MFERFNDRARQVVTLAQGEAVLLGHDYIGTEHLLLGLLATDGGVAHHVLGELGVEPDAVRAEVELIVGRGGHAPEGHIPFTPRAKEVLELSLREAVQLGHDFIGTEHLLLGLVREGQGVAAQVLVRRGAALDDVRRAVIEALSDRPTPETGGTPGVSGEPRPPPARSTGEPPPPERSSGEHRWREGSSAPPRISVEADRPDVRSRSRPGGAGRSSAPTLVPEPVLMLVFVVVGLVATLIDRPPSGGGRAGLLLLAAGAVLAAVACWHQVVTTGRGHRTRAERWAVMATLALFAGAAVVLAVDAALS